MPDAVLSPDQFMSPQAPMPGRVLHSDPAEGTGLVTVDLRAFVGKGVEVHAGVAFALLCTATATPSPAPTLAATSGAGRMHRRAAGDDFFVVHPEAPFLHVALSATGPLSVCAR